MRVIWPDEFETGPFDAGNSQKAHGPAAASSDSDAAQTDQPAILPFPTPGSRWSERNESSGIAPHDVSPAERAKIIHRNRLCRRCQRAFVSLILADDGRRDGTGSFVAGTQTLFGFRCESCHAEWSAEPGLQIASPGGV
ncbi:MAG: hypothetical protein ACYTGL_16930 [Planctomycetota bacterium]|jgi:hypothetical protein